MKATLFGFLVGLLMPVFGLFIGLQVSPTLANIMLFPLLFLSDLTGIVFGNASGFQWLLFFLFSGVSWALLFFAVNRLIKSRQKPRH